MAEWQRGKTVDLLSVLMNDPDARKDPHLRAVIKRLRDEHRRLVRENAQTVAQLATLTTENYKQRNSTTRRRKTTSGSNRRKTRSGTH